MRLARLLAALLLAATALALAPSAAADVCVPRAVDSNCLVWLSDATTDGCNHWTVDPPVPDTATGGWTCHPVVTLDARGICRTEAIVDHRQCP